MEKFRHCVGERVHVFEGQGRSSYEAARNVLKGIKKFYGEDITSYRVDSIRTIFIDEDPWFYVAEAYVHE